MEVAAASKMILQTAPDLEILRPLLDESARRHQHLCPRQVLGVRLGLAGLRELGLVDDCYGPRFDNSDKRLLTIVETDGCGADGVGIATDCVVGRRTLRVLDFGKVAATLVDTASSRAVRLAPSAGARSLATVHAPSADSLWHSYLSAYQSMPDQELMRIQRVELTRSLNEILSKPGVRVRCEQCGEEIMNEREIRRDGLTLCRSCAGESYYRAL
jgi:formylmethanofuran dehydrogenase subunit E